MKHAILLGVYKNPNYVRQMINTFLSDDRYNVYIHVNKKYWGDFTDLSKEFTDNSRVVFLHEVIIKWGGLGFLDSTLCMIKEAMKNPENQIFHLISAQDAIVKPVKEIADFFEKNKKNYIAYRPMPENRRHYYELYWLHSYFEVRTTGFFASIPSRFLKLQRRMGICRKFNMHNPQFGSCWWSLQRNAVLYVYDKLIDKANGIYKRLKYTFAADEMIFQTLLVNEGNFEIENNNLRYIRWSPNNTGSPDTLHECDYDEIVKSGAFFARKVDPENSALLIKRLLTS